MLGAGFFGKLRERLLPRMEQEVFRDKTSAQVYTLILRNVGSPFNDGMLWAHNPGLGDGVEGQYAEQDFRADWRLFAALSQYLAPAENVSAEGGFLAPTKQVFTDVILWIPQTVWDNKVCEEGGKPVERLITNLQLRHEREFGQHLWEKRKPNYCVMPDKRLEEGIVVCQFGTDIFVPDLQERKQPLAHVLLNNGADQYPLPELAFFREGQKEYYPAAWYKGQRALQLSSDPAISRLPLPDAFWHESFCGKGEFIRLRNTEPSTDKLMLEPLAPGFIINTKPLRGNQVHTFEKDGVMLRVIIQPATLPDPRPDRRGTYTRTFVGSVSSEPALKLVGIALPSLGQRSRNEAGWQLFLDDQGGFCQGSANNIPEHCARLFYMMEGQNLHWQLPDKPPQVLTMPTVDAPVSCSVGAAKYTLSVIPASGGRIGLTLPNPELFPLRKGWVYRLGRNPDILLGEKEEGITITTLDIPGSIFLASGQPLCSSDGKPITLGRILSSTQLELELQGKKLLVNQQSHNIDTQTLDEDGNPKKVLKAGGRGFDTLVYGEYIWVGSYIFQFDC